MILSRKIKEKIKQRYPIPARTLTHCHWERISKVTLKTTQLLMTQKREEKNLNLENFYKLAQQCFFSTIKNQLVCGKK